MTLKTVGVEETAAMMTLRCTRRLMAIAFSAAGRGQEEGQEVEEAVMAKKSGNWIQDAIKHKGALTKKAERAGGLTKGGIIKPNFLSKADARCLSGLRLESVRS